MCSSCRHGQYDKALLSFVRTLEDGDDILEDGDGAVVLAIGEALLGILVFVFVVCALVDPVELIGTTSEQERRA